jgi:inner membrane protein involved in colicin E2 resistance
MHGNKENQQISVVGRLVSLEALVILMGIVSLIYGLVAPSEINIVMGALILMVAAVAGRIMARRLGRHRHGDSTQGRR